MADQARIEKVARAICVARGILPDERVTRQRPCFLTGTCLMVVPHDDLCGAAWTFFQDDARAAIEAIQWLISGMNFEQSFAGWLITPSKPAS